MNDELHGNNGRPMSDQLDGSLLQAVEQIRAEPVPTEAMERTLDRVLHCSPIPPGYRFRVMFEIIAAVGVAAALMICLSFWSDRSKPVAKTDLVAAKETKPLPPGSQEVTLQVNAGTAVAGFAQPGSRVDVVYSKAGENGKETRVVLQNIEVRTADLKPLPPEDKPGFVPATVSLVVTPEQAQTLAKLKGQGTYSFMLRTATDQLAEYAHPLPPPQEDGASAIFQEARRALKLLKEQEKAPPQLRGVPPSAKPLSREADFFLNVPLFPAKPGVGGPGMGPRGGGGMRPPGGMPGMPGMPGGIGGMGPGGMPGQPGGGMGFGGNQGNFGNNGNNGNGGFNGGGGFGSGIGGFKGGRGGVGGTGGPGGEEDLKTRLGKPVLSKLPGDSISREEEETRLKQSLAIYKGALRSSTKEPTSQPAQTWTPNRQRPTFARVYVGNGNSLELVSLQVTVTIEGPRARTVVDYIFRNPHDRQLEGTFEYPLPTGASASYFAMFLGQTRDTVPPRFGREGNTPPLPAEALAKLTPTELVKHVNTTDWGRLQEARIVNKQKALETYEEIVRDRIDPALLEYAGGNTFSGRVFPIPAKGYNRVLIAYEELLPYTQAGVLYCFPLPDCKLAELQFRLNATTAEIKEAVFRPADARKEEGGSQVAFSRTWKDKGPGGEAIFAFTPPQPALQVTSGRQSESGPLYFYARVRPDLKVQTDKPFADHAVFLLDTSLSEYPDRFAINMALLRRILESDSAIKQFNILTFDVGARWVEPKGWLPNTQAGRAQAWKRLDGILLEGATDLSVALDQLGPPTGALQPPLAGLAKGSPLNVFLLSDGQITWGESEVASLVARFESRCPFRTRFHCYRTGIGAENQELFEALTRRGGGVFHIYGEADLAVAALAHRHQCFQVEKVHCIGGPAVNDLLVAGRQGAVYPGGDLVIAGRAGQPGRTQLVVEGTFLGQKFAQEYPVEITGGGELAPRGWAEIAVSSLLALNDSNLDSLITAYCQQFGIGSRVASFLVLENEADYKRLNLQEERGRTVPGGDLHQFLEEMWRKLGQAVSTREAFGRFLARVGPRVNLLAGENGGHVMKLLALLGDADYELPAGEIGGAILHESDVPLTYLKSRAADLRDVAPYVKEARRRADANNPAEAVRVLSSVIEEHPSRPDALRLVGYRLLDLKQPAQAVRLFRQVQSNRPFEPHSYRDLARGLEECGKFGLAAVQYEIVLAGTWHNRFRESLKQVALEEYVRMMRQAISKQAVSRELANHFGERLERLASTQTQSDLRVTISWNTDATDVDLWVIEPDGTKCYYQHNRTKNGGELSQDQTQGYGPERYQIRNAKPGVYTVVVHYYATNPNLLAGETHVNVVVTRQADSPQEQSQRYNVILKQRDEQVEVCRLKF